MHQLGKSFIPFGNKAKKPDPSGTFRRPEKPTVHNESKEHNELINEIVLASYNNLDQRDSCAFSFRIASG